MLSWKWSLLGLLSGLVRRSESLCRVTNIILIPRPEDEEVPPPLGLVLVNTFWRYICIPAITIPIIYGLRHIPSTRAFIQDPAYVSPFISLLYALISVIRPSCRIYQSPSSSYQHISLPSCSPFLASIRRPHYLRHPRYRSCHPGTRGIVRDRL
jgi:hypothetical protein